MNSYVRGFMLGAALIAAVVPARADEWTLEGVERVVAVSDIHGAHQAFIATLQAAGVIDAAQGWSAGATALVIVGDIVDRGDDSRQSMDLLMRLEAQAAAAGGAVHVVLGNHELMNLTGDLRYVARGEYAAFAMDESPAQRDAAFQRHRSAGYHAELGADEARRKFDEAYPPGFFAHRAAFAASGVYGRWLLGKPLLLRIDDTSFVHAGIADAAAALGSGAINGRLRRELIEYAGLLEQLTDEGVVEPTTDFYDIPDRLAAAPAANAASASAPADAAAQRIARALALHASFIHESASPLWYRGSVACGPLIEQSRLDAALATLNSKRVVVGHTPTWQRRVWSRLEGRVVQIDTGMLKRYYAGRGSALRIEGSRLTAIYEDDPQAVAVAPQPLRAGALTAGLANEEELEAALKSGDIVADVPAGSGRLLTLGWRGKSVQAEFLHASGKEGFAPEVAAYRLDRLLSLGMVPAAVLREVNGTRGTVRHVPDATLSETEHALKKTRLDAWCPLNDQFQAMYLFDALILNPGRTTDNILYSISGSAVLLTGHAAAFGTGTNVPPRLRSIELMPNAAWREKLAALRSEPAQATLREVLGARRLKALLARAERLGR